MDAEQNEIYRWYSETAYFNQCAVSSSGTNLAGIRLGQQNNDFLSTAVLFRTDREEPVAELALGNALYLDLAFLASRTPVSYTHLLKQKQRIYNYVDRR